MDAPRKELTITRMFDAPPSTVFREWTDPERIARWWGPNEFTSTVTAFDARAGGPFRLDMRGPDGTVYPGTGAFVEIDEPSRLVVTTGAFPDEAGNPGLEDITTVTFEDAGGRTRLTLHAEITKSSPELADAVNGMEQGWNESLDRLANDLREGGRPEKTRMEPVGGTRSCR